MLWICTSVPAFTARTRPLTRPAAVSLQTHKLSRSNTQTSLTGHGLWRDQRRSRFKLTNSHAQTHRFHWPDTAFDETSGGLASNSQTLTLKHTDFTDRTRPLTRPAAVSLQTLMLKHTDFTDRTRPLTRPAAVSLQTHKLSRSNTDFTARTRPLTRPAAVSLQTHKLSRSNTQTSLTGHGLWRDQRRSRFKLTNSHAQIHRLHCPDTAFDETSGGLASNSQTLTLKHTDFTARTRPLTRPAAVSLQTLTLKHTDFTDRTRPLTRPVAVSLQTLTLKHTDFTDRTRPLTRPNSHAQTHRLHWPDTAFDETSGGLASNSHAQTHRLHWPDTAFDETKLSRSNTQTSLGQMFAHTCEIVLHPVCSRYQNY